MVLALVFIVFGAFGAAHEHERACDQVANLHARVDCARSPVHFWNPRHE